MLHNASASVLDGDNNGNGCPSDQFRCDDGKCILGIRKCDGFDDCSAKEDEYGCRE